MTSRSHSSSMAIPTSSNRPICGTSTSSKNSGRAPSASPAASLSGWRAARHPPLPGRSGAQAPGEAFADLPEMALELKARMAADEHLIIDRQIVMSGGLPDSAAWKPTRRPAVHDLPRRRARPPASIRPSASRCSMTRASTAASSSPRSASSGTRTTPPGGRLRPRLQPLVPRLRRRPPGSASTRWPTSRSTTRSWRSPSCGAA